MRSLILAIALMAMSASAVPADPAAWTHFTGGMTCQMGSAVGTMCAAGAAPCMSGVKPLDVCAKECSDNELCRAYYFKFESGECFHFSANFASGTERKSGNEGVVCDKAGSRIKASDAVDGAMAGGGDEKTDMRYECPAGKQMIKIVPQMDGDNIAGFEFLCGRRDAVVADDKRPAWTASKPGQMLNQLSVAVIDGRVKDIGQAVKIFPTTFNTFAPDQSYALMGMRIRYDGNKLTGVAGVFRKQDVINGEQPSGDPMTSITEGRMLGSTNGDIQLYRCAKGQRINRLEFGYADNAGITGIRMDCSDGNFALIGATQGDMPAVESNDGFSQFKVWTGDRFRSVLTNGKLFGGGGGSEHRFVIIGGDNKEDLSYKAVSVRVRQDNRGLTAINIGFEKF